MAIYRYRYRKYNKNRFNLSNPELEMLIRLANGLENREIGRDFAVSEHTIKLYLTQMFKKMKVSNRCQAVYIAMKNKIIY